MTCIVDTPSPPFSHLRLRVDRPVIVTEIGVGVSLCFGTVTRSLQVMAGGAISRLVTVERVLVERVLPVSRSQTVV